MSELIGGLPARTRAVIGLGFGLTDPQAVERLASAGADVRVVVDRPGFPATRFHPKLYMIETGRELTVFSGSANLTGSGLRGNVEQYEELRIRRGDHEAIGEQQRRFDALWSYGAPLVDVQRSGAWAAYNEAVSARRSFERQLRRLPTRSRRARSRPYSTRRVDRMPGWIDIAEEEWWENQCAMRHANGIAYMRALAPGAAT